jgi:putative ABC transport system permease protein
MSITAIPSLKPVSWAVAFTVSWRSLKRRFLRSLITMIGVVLGIAFLVYMRVTNDITAALIAVNDPGLNQRLQEKGVDIFGQAGADRMMIHLIGLSLVICMVGIVNAMLMSVTERVKEIGTLKCLGALDSFIVKTYFIESSLQGVLGTALGLVLGLLVALVVTGVSYRGYVLTHLPIGPVAVSLLLGLVLGSLMSVAAAVGPALFAARKEPVEAMRVEE